MAKALMAIESHRTKVWKFRADWKGITSKRDEAWWGRARPTSRGRIMDSGQRASSARPARGGKNRLRRQRLPGLHKRAQLRDTLEPVGLIVLAVATVGGLLEMLMA
jgi:hypothetical protein